LTTSNICKLKSYKNWDMYAVHCDCSSQEHTKLLSIEYDPDFEMLSANLSQTVTIASYYGCHSDSGIRGNIQYFFKEAKYRIKWAYNLLVHGYIEAQSEFIFAGREAVQDYVNVLQEGLDKYPESSKYSTYDTTE
jgi:hypothetical protein